jgi:hypothetical protein
MQNSGNPALSLRIDTANILSQHDEVAIVVQFDLAPPSHLQKICACLARHLRGNFAGTTPRCNT